jgi:hypothetical protein
VGVVWWKMRERERERERKRERERESPRGLGIVYSYPAATRGFVNKENFG